MPDDTARPKLDIDWSRTLAGALAAMSSAVLLSTLGAVGTLIGAAVGSLVATIGTALYAQGLAKSREKVALAQVASRNKIAVAKAEVRRARRGTNGPTTEIRLEHAEEELAEAEAELDGAVGDDHEVTPGDPAPDGPPADLGLGWRERLARLPWKRIALSAAATFVVVVLAIVIFELIAGRSVSSYTGGSDRDRTSTFIGGGEKAEQDTDTDTDQQTPEQDPTDSTTPGQEPPAEPTDVPSATPTELPTVVPSATPSE